MMRRSVSTQNLPQPITIGARSKGKLGQHTAAIADFDLAIRLDPSDGTAYDNRGLAQGKLGQYFSAIDDFDAGIRLDPNDAAAYGNRGNAKAYLGQHIAAISDYDVAIRLDPKYARAYVNRGIAKDNVRTTHRCHRRLQRGHSP